MTKILSSKKNLYKVDVNEDGSLFIQEEEGESVKNAGAIISNYGGIDNVKKCLIETDLSFSEYKQMLADRREASKKANSERDAKLLEEAMLIFNNHDSEPAQVYVAFQKIRNINTGWMAAEKAFMTHEKTKALLLSKIGSFTVTPYDNGEVIIKHSDSCKYSNLRHCGYKNLADLFE